MNTKKLISALLVAILSFGVITPIFASASETTVNLISTLVTMNIPGSEAGSDVIYVGNGNKEDNPEILIVDKDGNIIKDGTIVENPKITSPDGIDATIDEDRNLLIKNNTKKDIEKLFVQYIDNDGDGIYDEIIISALFKDGTTAGNIPQMGDNTPVVAISIAAIGSALVIGGIIFTKRKNSDNKDDKEACDKKDSEE